MSHLSAHCHLARPENLTKVIITSSTLKQYLCLNFFLVTSMTEIMSNIVDSDQTAPKKQSDQGLHCLLGILIQMLSVTIILIFIKRER